MESARHLNDKNLLAIYEQWPSGSLSEQLNQYRDGYEELKNYPMQTLLALAELALQKSFHEGAISFLLLSVLALQAAKTTPSDFPDFQNVTVSQKTLLSENLSTWMARMKFTETPSPSPEPMDFQVGELYSVEKKLDRLNHLDRIVDFNINPAISMLCSAFRLLDEPAYFKVINTFYNLSTIHFALSMYPDSQLAAVDFHSSLTNERVALVLLWRFNRPTFSADDNTTSKAIVQLLNKFKSNYPGVYPQVIHYFQHNDLFATGFAAHLADIVLKEEMEVALQPLQIYRSSAIGSPPHPISRQFLALSSDNLILYLETIHEKWRAWHQSYLTNADSFLTDLALSGFEKSIEAYYRTCLSDTALANETLVVFQSLTSLDTTWAKNRNTVAKTVWLLFTQLHFLAKGLEFKDFRTPLITQLAGSFLNNKVWMGRYVGYLPKSPNLRQFLEQFSK